MPAAAWAGDGVRGGDVGIGAVIDVEHDALRAFEQDAAAGAARLVEPLPDRLGIGQDLRRDLAQRLLAAASRSTSGAPSARSSAL